jgi:hypothetical protein
MATYRPSAQVTLYLRADELDDTSSLVEQLRGQTTVSTPLAPPVVPSSLVTAGDIDEAISAYNDILAGLEIRAQEDPEYNQTVENVRALRDQLVAQRLAGASPERPPAVVGQSPDGRYIRNGIIPIDVEIERNSFRTADTATLTLNWKDVPFDPRLVRAAGIEVIVGAVSPEDFAAGVAGQRGDSGQLRSIVRQRPTGDVVGSAVRFAGWVDTWNVKYSGDTADTVQIECRDFTALFLDTPLASGSGIDLTKPIQDGVQEFIDSYNSLRGFPVRFGDPIQPDTPAGTPPTPADVLPAVARSRGQTRQTRRGDQRMNVWDHITDVCVPLNLIPIVVDYTLWLSPPRTLYTGGNAQGQHPVRRMVFGRNLSALEFTRKLGGTKVPTIEARCYDPSVGRTRWARYPVRPGEPTNGVFGQTEPPPALRPNEPGISGARPDNRIQTFVVRPLASGEALANVARGLFEQIGRQEIEGNLETSDLSSWDIETDTPLDSADLLRIQSGESVELLVAPRDPRIPESTPNSVAELAALSVQGRVDYLVRLGWDESVARRFAEWQQGAGFQTVFRVQNSRVSYSADEGIKLKLDFINYITVREDAPANQAAARPAESAAGLPPLSDVGTNIPDSPAPEVAALLEGREDTLADLARRASARRIFTENQRALGLATDNDVADAITVESGYIAAAQTYGDG